MEQDRDKLRALTRALIVGVAVGTPALSLSGCVTPMSVQRQGDSAEARSAAFAAVASGSPRSVERVIREYPNAGSTVDMLNALPASVLVRVSPAAVRSLPAASRNQLSPSVLRVLRIRPAPSEARSASAHGGY
ncbi:hypothetical protein [Chthonobacter rhizosphaerae]|uniref:hypothetical protein n=1 Tax=Chthonobacter rhizosphaerae TaxID=2735553 RepID=UPI0015EF4A0E|nr:hypothetical protein [Chthonobacter rhizosphaerae]